MRLTSSCCAALWEQQWLFCNEIICQDYSRRETLLLITDKLFKGHFTVKTPWFSLISNNYHFVFLRQMKTSQGFPPCCIQGLSYRPGNMTSLPARLVFMYVLIQNSSFSKMCLISLQLVPKTSSVFPTMLWNKHHWSSWLFLFYVFNVLVLSALEHDLLRKPVGHVTHALSILYGDQSGCPCWKTRQDKTTMRAPGPDHTVMEEGALVSLVSHGCGVRVDGHMTSGWRWWWQRPQSRNKNTTQQ